MESELARLRVMRGALAPDSPPALVEALEEQARCSRCGVPVGAAHLPECVIARCLVTGYQRVQCVEQHDHGLEIWSGVYPGTLDAIELGLWARLDPGHGWLPATPADDDAIPDLNALRRRCHWDAARQRWKES